MKYNVYLLNYNNYYNRQVKKLDTIQEYIQTQDQNYLNPVVENINVAFGDGLSSELVINQSYVSKQPDYCLIEERHESNEPSVFSRWFIIDSNLTRGGQYHFTIKRDICVDFYDLMLNSTYFIERGYVQDTNDLIFNDEGQKYSQIKKAQTPLYDETGCPWIVGYIDKKWNGGSVTSYSSIGTDYVPINDITQWPYYDYTNLKNNHSYIYAEKNDEVYRYLLNLPVNNSTISQKDLLHLNVNITKKAATDTDIKWLDDDPSINMNMPYVGVGWYHVSDTTFTNKVSVTKWYNDNQPSNSSYKEIMYKYLLDYQINILGNPLLYSNLLTYIRDEMNFTFNNQMATDWQNSVNGRVYKDLATGKIYRATVKSEIIEGDIPYATNSDLGQYLHAVTDLSLSTPYGETTNSITEIDTDQIEVFYKVDKIWIELTEDLEAAATIPNSSTRRHLIDGTYDMFAIPYGDVTMKYLDNGVNKTLTMSKELSISIAQAIAVEGATNVFDVQILPYCPIREAIYMDTTNNIINVTALDSSAYSLITDTSVNPVTIGFIFYPSKCQESNIILRGNTNSVYSISVGNIKREYNTQMYRLSSPNFASSFEFSPAMNGGVNQFLMSFTYKPYNPYIRVRPEFGRMYYQDYVDARGLILQGDFSIPTLTDQWKTFEVQNKNYQNTFNREIDSLELQHEIGSNEDFVRAITGTVQGTTSGALAGGIVGGPAVGAVTGLLSGALSAGAGIADINNNEKLRNDAIDKAKTLFNYNLQNIQALPRTIRNVGCLTADNILVPVIEFYEASDDEIDAFNQKIKYYGMSVNKIGKIYDYLKQNDETFIQGYLIRLLPPDGVIEESDNHFSKTLSEEVQKGLYIGG